MTTFGPIAPGGRSGVYSHLPGARTYPVSPHVFNDILFLHQRVKDSGQFNYRGLRLPVPTPLHVCNFRALLIDYHDETLCDHIEFGFPLGYERSVLPAAPHTNHKSAVDYAESVDDYIFKLIQRGALVGPFDCNPLSSPLTISPLQTVDKAGSDQRRVVFDLSYPKGKSVNDGIPKETYLGEPHNLTFPTVDTLVQMVIELGQGCKLMKADMKAAYKQLFCDPGDYHRDKLRDKLFVELTFPFGARSAALNCQRLTNAVTYIHNQLGYGPLVNYLDDFAKAEKPALADSAFVNMLYVLQDLLNIELGPEKIVAPSEQMVFLGILIDTIKMTMSIPEDKLQVAVGELKRWKSRNYASQKQLQSLLGRLCHIATCVRPGRRFVARIIEAVRSKDFPVPLDAEFQMDITWCESDSVFSMGTIVQH